MNNMKGQIFRNTDFGLNDTTNIDPTTDCKGCYADCINIFDFGQGTANQIVGHYNKLKKLELIHFKFLFCL